ncbi:MAG: hypothetical protein ACR2M4_11260 [Actinomycetota bacterium]
MTVSLQAALNAILSPSGIGAYYAAACTYRIALGPRPSQKSAEPTVLTQQPPLSPVRWAIFI